MTLLRIPAAGALALVLVSTLFFDFVQDRLSSPLLAFGVHPEIVERLEQSAADQRELARHDPDHETFYRERFASIETLVRRLHVVDHNREEILRRYRRIVLSLFAALVLVVAGAFVWQRQRQEARLARVREALAALVEGRTDVELGERRRDTLGRIARMIERTSRVMARDRRRLAALTNLSAWQEAARRHAHEMRTPLTGARLELTRLASLLAAESLVNGDEIRQAARSAGQEIERLGAFAQQFTSFARLPRPEKRRQDLVPLVEELVATFEGAWSNLELDFERPAEPVVADVDRDMLRQVLVNLCDNSSLALGDKKGRVVLGVAAEGGAAVVRLADDGPGIAPEVRPRLFEPYTTTRKIGHGMGLGLAISKKILLDHDGDLELERTSEEGTTFRLTLPRSAPEEVKKC